MVLGSGQRDFGRHKRLFLTTLFVYLAQLVLGVAIIYFVSVIQTKNFISDIAQEVKQDIIYKDGKWDTARYDSDPQIPGNFRLYIITKDGYVIDRWRPIKGFLDTSDYKQLLTYQTIQSVNTITGQKWRIFSLPIKNHNKDTIGVVTVGHYSNAQDELAATDQLLTSSAEQLASKIKTNSWEIDTSQINVRDVPFEVSFQIVDQYNTIHIKSDNASSIDRLPNYIDPSYISQQLRQPTLRTVNDNVSDTFLVHSIPLFDQHQSPIGTIIIGRTISPYISLIRWYILFSALAEAIIIGVAAGYLWMNKKSLIEDFNAEQEQAAAVIKLTATDVNKISFNKVDCIIKINTKAINVTYASNQYYMCIALLNSPRKKWETDELLDKFGEENHRDGWRKIYDTMSTINKKVAAIADFKLFVTNNKTYQVNPELVAKVKKEK
ncbi:MAG: hypothetical protein ACXWLH_02075 [Candidatus Saccharimonadales bacterium]